MLKSIWTDTVNRFNTGDTVIQLIIINVVVWIGVILFGLFAAPFVGIGNPNPVVDWLAVPGSGGQLLTRPWTIFTYMFTHEGFFHILWNMILLFWFGRILENYLGNKRIIPLYVLGGLAGFAVYFLSKTFMPADFANYIGSPMLGASAGVMAVVMGAATIVPTHPVSIIIIGPVQIRYIALLFILLDLVGVQTGSNTGGHLAHLGGVALGFFFMEQLKEGNDWSVWFNRLLGSMRDFFSGANRPQKPKRRPAAASASKRSSKAQSRRASKAQGGMTADDRQARIDAILDKIRESGYSNVTAEEMAFLNQVSEENAKKDKD